MYFTVNKELHSLHTVKSGSKLEAELDKRTFSKSMSVKVGHYVHVVFKSASDAQSFHDFLYLHGGL